MNIMIELITAGIIASSALLTGVLGIRLNTSIRRFRPDSSAQLPDEVPSVSVCIPARNEVHAVARCLERVLSSDYKKLEVLVFDDASSDTTSIIIRSFAQAGVRFVSGTGVPDGWLGKNYALDVLAREASGTYVLFMNVDTAIAPTTIRRLVAYAHAENAAMVSVVPERADGWRFSVVFGYLRYFWELTTQIGRGPATGGALWMINRQLLVNEFGGLAPLRSTAAPESAVAAMLDPASYRCLISGPEIEVAFEKKWSSQLEASRRLLYPRVGGTIRGFTVAVVSLCLLISPLFVFIGGFAYGWSSLQVAAAITLMLGMAVYGLYAKHLWRRVWWVAPIVWPVVLLQELVFLFSSVIGYWRHTITWKGRLVSPSTLPRQIKS